MTQRQTFFSSEENLNVKPKDEKELNAFLSLIEKSLANASRYTPPYLKFTLCGSPKQASQRIETKATAEAKYTLMRFKP